MAAIEVRFWQERSPEWCGDKPFLLVGWAKERSDVPIFGPGLDGHATLCPSYKNCPAAP